MLEQLAARLDAQPVPRVAVAGVDGAGKTTFAGELAAVLRQRGQGVIRASVEGFHNPSARRYCLGRYSPEGFYRDSHNYVGLRRALLEPLGSGGSLRYQTAIFDVETDHPVSRAELAAQPGSVLIVDGLFLHCPELCGVWDDSIFLRVGFAVSVPRGAARGPGSSDPAAESNQRYIGGNDTDSDWKVLETPGNPNGVSRRKTGSGRGVWESALSRFLHETDGIRMNCVSAKLTPKSGWTWWWTTTT